MSNSNHITRNLLIATIVWIVVALGGMRLYFGSGNLTGEKAIQSAVVGIPTGVIFWGLLIATIIARVKQNRQTEMKKFQTGRSWHRFIWVYFFGSALIQFISVAISWNWAIPVSTTVADGPFRTALFAFSIVFQVLLVGAWKWISGLSWHEAIFGFGGMKGADERERLLINRASALSLYVAIMMMMLAAALMVVLPQSASVSYGNILNGLVSLVIGLRGFFAWRAGLR